jgi:uncharacterized protein YbcI
MTDTQLARGELLVAVSNRIVAIYKELYGKGPVKVRSWYLDDALVCVLRGGLTRSEQTFIELGYGDRVVLQRDSFHKVAAPVFKQAVEDLTGRCVATVLDATHEEHDVSTLVFLFESPEEAALRATQEGAMREQQQIRRRAGELRLETRRLREQSAARRKRMDGPGT